MYVYHEELTEDETREAKLDLLDTIETRAWTICLRAKVPTSNAGGRTVVMTDACWCPDPHTITEDDVQPNLTMRMRIGMTHVHCPKHGTKFNARQLLDILPLGKRKNKANKDALLNQINLPVGPTRFYVFQGGSDFDATGIDTDPATALIDAHPNHKEPLRGCLVEVRDKRRAREVIDSKADELPWADLVLRDDGSLVANWHGAPLTDQEKLKLSEQQAQTMATKRKARQRLVDKMRREIDAKAIEPL